jgi:hypothetical protein
MAGIANSEITYDEASSEQRVGDESLLLFAFHFTIHYSQFTIHHSKGLRAND